MAVGQATVYSYARDPAPAFRMLADMRAASPAQLPVLAMHRRQEFDLRRSIRWAGNAMAPLAGRLASPPRLEWLEPVKYWNAGGRSPVWFVADTLRSDLALVDRSGPPVSYRWPVPFPGLLGGVRPNIMDWYTLHQPGWYLGEGWSLTPETAGVSARSGRGPGRAPIEGWIRRRPEPLTLMIGGRNFSGAAARLRVALDGRTVDEMHVSPGFFLRMAALPAGSVSGDGDYAAMVVAAEPAGTSRGAAEPSGAGDVAIEQFDAQSAGHVLFGFGDGWHEQEYNPSTGALWRWTSERAAILVRAEGHAVTLTVSGESEASGQSHVVVRVGDRIIAEQDIGRSFAIRATIPAAVFGPGESTITIETNRTYVPAERRWSRSRDQRRLGLKISQCEITPAF